MSQQQMSRNLRIEMCDEYEKAPNACMVLLLSRFNSHCRLSCLFHLTFNAMLYFLLFDWLLPYESVCAEHGR